MEMEARHGRSVGHRIGLATWFVGFALLVYNLWLLRSASAHALLWASAPAAVLIGALVSAHFALRSDPEGKPFGTRVATLIGSAFGLSLFFWLTAVSPTTSDAGRRATEFFTAVAADDMDAAYEMLSEEAKSRIPREQFAEHLPANYKAQRGSSVNGASGSLGTAVGDSSCVDGWLDVPAGMRRKYAMGLNEDDDGIMRINTIAVRPGCG